MFNNLSIASILCKKEAHPLVDYPQDVLQIAFAVLSKSISLDSTILFPYRIPFPIPAPFCAFL